MTGCPPCRTTTRCSTADGAPRAHAAALAAALEALGRDGARRRRPPARRDLHAAGHHVRRRRRRRRRADATARSRSTSCRGSSRPRSGRTIKRGLAQRIRALNHFVDDVYHGREIVHDGMVPWDAGRLAAGVRPRRARDPAAGRRLLPRLRLRPRARRRRLVEGARGQRPHAERDLLRAREPARDDAPAARAVRRHYRVRPVDHYPALLPTALRRGRADRRRGGGDRRRLDAGPVQLRLLRARVPRAPDGRRARRGVRPRRPRRASATSAPPTGCSASTRSTAGIDDDFMDPLEFRPDSLLGVPGLMRAYRAGHASRSSTRSAPASPTTRRSTTTCRR